MTRLKWKYDRIAENYVAEDGDRYGLVWRFGPIWQCKFFIDKVGICLEPRKKAKTAKLHVEQSMANWPGTKTPEEVYQQALKNWPDLFKYRHEVIAHVWFGGGTGYTWLDGGLVNTSPEEKAENRKFDDFEQKLFEIEERMIALGIQGSNRILEQRKERELKHLQFDVYNYMYGNIRRIPDNVRPDWMDAAIEAAELVVSNYKEDDAYFLLKEVKDRKNGIKQRNQN